MISLCLVDNNSIRRQALALALTTGGGFNVIQRSSMGDASDSVDVEIYVVALPCYQSQSCSEHLVLYADHPVTFPEPVIELEHYAAFPEQVMQQIGQWT